MESEKRLNLQHAKGKNETISELAHRHLTDQYHTTSDEELKNAELELTEDAQVDEENFYEVANTTVIPPLSFASNSRDENDDKDKDRTITTPFDVLGS